MTLSHRWMLAQHSWYILRKHGVCHWIAWKLVCLSRRLCDTTYYEAIVHGDFQVIVESEAWGGGAIYTTVIGNESHWQSGEFDSLDKAVDWAEYTARKNG